MVVNAQCHCGATKIRLKTMPAQVTECNCTFCSRTGALWAYCAPEELNVETKDDRSYSVAGMNQHHFCGTCGMQTHGYSPDWGSIFNLDGTPKEGVQPDAFPTTQKAALNARMVSGLDLSTLKVTQVDGL